MGGLKDQLVWSWREDRFHGVARLIRRLYLRAVHLGEYRAEQALRHENDRQYPDWLDASLPDASERERQAQRTFSHRVTFLIPTWNTRPELLTALIASIRGQTSPCWEVCFYDGASTSNRTKEILSKLPEEDPRFHVLLGEKNLGISGNTNAALEMAETDYCALCDHDDLLSPDAVYCLLAAAEGGADLIYSDEDKVDETGITYYDPHLKGEYAPDTLRAGNYFCHLMAASTELLRKVGGLRSECDGSQDHDLALRLAVCARQITHIPRILYHWRMLATSASHDTTERCANAAVRAVKNQLDILGLPGDVFRDHMQPRIQYRTDREAKISLISTGGAAEIKKLKRLTKGQLIETLSATEDSLNEAAKRATGTYLVFAASGILPERDTWLQELLMFAQRPDVACVGAPLIKKSGLYLHAGYAMDVPGGALSYHHGATLWGRPYQLNDRVVRNVTGVSAAWMMIRRDLFLSLGGFGEYRSDLRGAVLGWHAVKAGYVNVITPYARGIVRGKPSCLIGPAPEADLERLDAEGQITEHYYSPLFERKLGTMSPDFDHPIPSYGEVET